jgi:hypothetical protein
VSVLDASRLVYEYRGPNAKDGWTVFDAGDQPVATVDTPGLLSGDPTYRMADTAGQPLVAVSYLNPGIIAQAGLPLAVLDRAGAELGRFVPPSLNSRSESVYDLVIGNAPVGRLTVTHTSSAITDAGITDGAGARVVTIGQGRKKISLFKRQVWFTVERPPELADPLRFFAVAAPLAIHLDIAVRDNMSRKSTWDPR